MIIRSEPKASPFVLSCVCGAVIPLDAATQEEADREAAVRHICPRAQANWKPNDAPDKSGSRGRSALHVLKEVPDEKAP